MEVQVSHSICTEVSQTGDIWEAQGGCGKNSQRVKRKEGGGNHRSRVLPGLHPHVGSDTASYECSPIHGILEK